MNEKLIELLNEITANPSVLTKDMIATIGDQYKKPIYAVLGYLFDLTKDLLANDDYFATSAKMKKKMYDAYVEAGFTESQAFSLMMDWHKGIANNSTAVTSAMRK